MPTRSASAWRGSAADLTLRSLVAIVVLVVAAPAARADQRAKVIVIPLAGELPSTLAGSPERLTRVLVDAGKRAGHDASLSQAAREDVLALAGCSDESPACWEQVRATLGVKRVVSGRVSRGPTGTTIVDLVVAAEGEAPRSRRVELTATDPQLLADEFAPVAPSAYGGEGSGEAIDDPFAAAPDRTGTGTGTATGGLPPADPAATVTTAPPPAPQPSLRFDVARVQRHSWIITAAGGGAMLTSALFFVLADGKQDEVDDAPTSSFEDLEALEDLESTGRLYTLLGNGLIVSGTIAVIAGGVLIGMQGFTREEAAPPIAITPALIPGGAGLTLTVRGDP